mgnify:CR=1 FL=1
MPLPQVGDFKSGHQDRDRSRHDEHVDVRASRTSSSGSLRIELLRSSGGHGDSFVRCILSLALLTVGRHRPRSAVPGPACRGTGTLPARKKRHRAAHLHPLACPAHLPPSQQEPSSPYLSFPLPPRRLSAGGAAQQPANFGPTSMANPVRSGTGGGGWDYVDIAGFLERYRFWGVWERVGTRARPQRDRTTCTICACRRVCLPACNRGERCSPLHPEWGPVAPASPRCWSSENDFKQVHLPSLAPSSPPHSPSARGSACARLSHMLLRAAQVAMMALLGAREHLEHPPARIELLYNIIRRSMGRLGRGWASRRVPCDLVVSARRCPGALPAPFLIVWRRKRSCARLC